jgi:hypothetical protein
MICIFKWESSTFFAGACFMTPSTGMNLLNGVILESKKEFE